MLEQALLCAGPTVSFWGPSTGGDLSPHWFEGLLGASPQMRDVFGRLATVARFDSSVCIQGETGTGKELVARAIVNRSVRRAGPFIAVNASAIAETLFEAQLFGYEAGAFTDARGPRAGLFQAAHTGTLFLDEIADVPLALQPKVLRAVEEGEVFRLGSVSPVRVDVRILVATNRDLRAAVAAGRFRADLFHRISGVSIGLPPLRERVGDVKMLVEHFLPIVAREINVTGRISSAAMDALELYDWPGNVREVPNVLREALVMAGGETIDLCHLPAVARSGSLDSPSHSRGCTGATLTQAWALFERAAIRDAMAAARGNREAAARRLGIDSKTLRRKLTKYGADGSRRDILSTWHDTRPGIVSRGDD